MDSRNKNPRMERLDREILHFKNKQRDEIAKWELYQGNETHLLFIFGVSRHVFHHLFCMREKLSKNFKIINTKFLNFVQLQSQKLTGK